MENDKFLIRDEAKKVSKDAGDEEMG